MRPIGLPSAVVPLQLPGEVGDPPALVGDRRQRALLGLRGRRRLGLRQLAAQVVLAQFRHSAENGSCQTQRDDPSASASAPASDQQHGQPAQRAR